MISYVSLHNHTSWSLMQSLIKPEQLFARAKELGQPAIAVTDYSTLAGAWDSLQASKKTGIKLIIGCDFNFVDSFENELELPRNIVLLAKNHNGYKNLLKCSKLAFDNHIIIFKKVVPRINWEILEKCSEDLICLTGGGNGILARPINTRKLDEAEKQAVRLKQLFGDSLGLEILPNAMRRNKSDYNDYEDQRYVNNQLIKLGEKLDIKVVAANDAHYLKKEDWEGHDVQLCIGSGTTKRQVNRLRFTVNDFYLKTGEEVYNFFSRLYKEKAKEFCENSFYFADMCEDPEWIDPKFSNPSGKELPEFPVKDESSYKEFLTWRQKNVPDNLAEDKAYLRYWCEQEFSKRVPLDKTREYRDRLSEELNIIEKLDFSSYMLIVSDIIRFAKNSNIPVGAGRGSGCGCLVGYITGVHQADPIKYNLIFERFINVHKKEYPDYDLDIASHGKSWVQNYIVDKYGRDQVAHVSNIITMTPKPYVKDIARTFEYGGTRKTAVEVGNNIADSIPGDIKTNKQVFEKAPLFMEYASQEEYSHLKKYADLLDHVPKAWGTHAGGIIIGKRPLSEIVPLRVDKENNVAVEYEKERAETNGLVKIDVLAISSLDIINNTLHLIKENGKTPPIQEIVDYDANDAKTYDLISRGDTLCVFQLGESGGTIELCRQIKPKCLEDLAIVIALARPSAKDIRKDFIKARRSGQEADLIHQNLKRAFATTYGFAVFEDSLMYLAQDVAGWNMTEADRLRKLTKDKGKHPQKVAKWREDFINSSVEKKNIPRKTAIKIWDDIVANYGGYAFNKSHAIGYSLLSYQTAYLKAHFPLEFLTANLMRKVNSNAPNAKETVAKIKNEIKARNVKIIPPDINTSEEVYKIIDDHSLMTGFDALNYMGKDSIPEIVENRPYHNLDDLFKKTSAKKLRLPSVQAMASAGCLDAFGLTRKQMFLYSQDYRKKLEAWNRRFKDKKSNDYKPFKYPWPDNIGEWTMSEKYAMELKYINEGLCCGFKDAYPGFFSYRSIDFSNLSSIFPDPGSSRSKLHIYEDDHGSLEGVVISYFEFVVKNETSSIFGETMAKMELEDIYGNSVSVTLFPSGIKKFNERLKQLTRNKIKLEPGIAVHIAGSINWYDNKPSIIFEDLKRCAPLPKIPQDLKHKKVLLRVPARKRKKSKKADPIKVMNEVEDELIIEGHAI